MKAEPSLLVTCALLTVSPDPVAPCAEAVVREIHSHLQIRQRLGRHVSPPHDPPVFVSQL